MGLPWRSGSRCIGIALIARNGACKHAPYPLFPVGTFNRVPHPWPSTKGAFTALSAASGKNAPDSDVGTEAWTTCVDGAMISLPARRIGQSRCIGNPSPDSSGAAIQREGLGQAPGLFPSRWQPRCDKRNPSPTRGLRCTHTEQRGAFFLSRAGRLRRTPGEQIRP